MVNYWDNHGILFLFFITIFPRLTLLFSSVAFGGFLWWLGFIFAPRILVAVLATMSYLESNPILVIMSWLIALSGESTEKYTFRRRFKIIRPNVNRRTSQNKEPSSLDDGEVLDAEYKRIR